MKSWLGSKFAVIALAVALHALAPALAAKPESCGPRLREEFEKLEDTLQDNAFLVTRGLKDYAAYLGPRFMEKLRKLGPNDHWIDFGAGSAYAMIEFGTMPWIHSLVKRFFRRPPKMTATGFKMPIDGKLYDFLADQPTKAFQYLDGRYVEDLTAETIGGPPASLITDIYGAMAYTPDPNGVLKKAHELLAVGGEFHFSLPITAVLRRRVTPSWGRGFHSGVAYAWEEYPVFRMLGDGSAGTGIDPRNWIRTLKGFEIVEMTNLEADDFSIESQQLRVILRKVPDVPFDVAWLRTVRFNAGAPPVRVYRLRR